MNPVVHFEMPYTDKNRVMTFYADVFGWKLQAFGEDMGNYIVATTAEDDVQPDAARGAIGGGFFPADALGQDVSPTTNIVIGVDDIAAHVARVKAAGGQVLGEMMEIPGIGQYAMFLDTEGTRVSMLQAAPPEAPAAA